jgi:hypothetical protein
VEGNGYYETKNLDTFPFITIIFKSLKRTIFLVGMPLAEAEELSRDFTTRLVVTELGRGHFRHQLIR